MRSRNFFLCALILLGCVSCAGSNPQGRRTGALHRLGFGDSATIEPELRQPAGSDAISQAPLTQQERKALTYTSQLRFSNDAFARERVERQFLFLSRDIRMKVAAWLTRSEKYLGHARKVFQQKGLPTDLAYLAMIESGYNPEAVSSSGAAGIWQFMPFTGRRFNLRCDWWIDERRDPYKAAQAAATYLSELYQQFKDWSLAIAAYNAGEGKIGRAIAVTNSRDFFDLAKKNYILDEKARLRDETLDYVPRFIAMVIIANNLEQLGFQPINTRAAPELHALQAPGGTDLRALARAAGMTQAAFAEHNPAFRREATPPGEHCIVYVPSQLSANARRFLSTPQATRYAAYRHYTVQRGDTWSKIARTSQVSEDDLKGANTQSAKNGLRPGQQIIVPAPSLAASAKAAPSGQPPAPKPLALARAPQRATQSIQYRVRPGDTVYSIARHFSASVDAVQQANNLSSRPITPGQVLLIPASTQQSASASSFVPAPAKVLTTGNAPAKVQQRTAHYRVRSGDTVWSIARKFNVDPSDIVAQNNLKNNSIQAGEQIQIALE